MTKEVILKMNKYNVNCAFGDEHYEAEVQIQEGMSRKDARDMFVAALNTEIGFKGRGYVSTGKTDKEYAGHGGVYEVLLTNHDNSGYVVDEGWIEAILVK